jgi:hypothetical protein
VISDSDAARWDRVRAHGVCDIHLKAPILFLANRSRASD